MSKFKKHHQITIRAALAVSLLLLLPVTLWPQLHPMGRTRKKGSVRRSHSGFRYIIWSNQLVHGSSRLVFVLLDDRSFSEENLKNLFALISKRFKEPDDLHVVVYSSLEQIPTPEEEDAEQRSTGAENDETANLRLQKAPTAVYIRSQGNESFSFVMYPHDKTERTMVLNGKDLLHKK